MKDATTSESLAAIQTVQEMRNDPKEEELRAVREEILKLPLSDWGDDPPLQESLREVLLKRSAVFVGLGQITGTQHNITAKPGTEPIAEKYRNRSPEQKARGKRAHSQIDEGGRSGA